MKITPLEIRQKTFEKKLRGYDKEEVEAFLMSLSQEWEQTQEELKELKLQYVNAEKEIKQLREVENSLFKTLKTAEDTGANLIDQANKTAELHMRETQMNADALLNEAKSKARATIEDADMRARHILDKMEVELSHIKQDYKHLENLRDGVIDELRNLSNDILSRIGKFDTESKPATHTPKVVEEKKEVVEEEIVQERVDTVAEAEQPQELVEDEPSAETYESEEPVNVEKAPIVEDPGYSFAGEQISEEEPIDGDQAYQEPEEKEPVEEKPAINSEESNDDDISFFDKIQ